MSLNTSTRCLPDAKALHLRVTSILSPLQFSPSAIEAYLGIPPLTVSDKNGAETQIPVSFIRTKARQFQKTWMSAEDATHYIFFTQGSESLLYPVHEWVIASQSSIWHRLSPNGDVIEGRPVVPINLPHADSIDAILEFLHTHEEWDLWQVVVREWRQGSKDGEDWVRGMVANIVRLGVLDDRFRGVIWAVIEP